MRRSRGLTLAEILVGLLGLAIVLNMLFASIAGGLKVERTADMRMTAVRLAASQRAMVGMSPFDDLRMLAGAKKENVGGKEYIVETTVEKEEGGSGPDGTEERYNVMIVVRWQDGARPLHFDLALKRSRL